MRLLALPVLALFIQEAKPADFIPIKEGAVWTYVTGSSEGKVTVVGREKIGEVETWVVETQMGTNRAEKEYLTLDATGLRMVRRKSGENVTDFATPFMRIKLPPTKGDTWEWKGELGKDKVVATFTNDGEEEITVPAGKFKAWKISAVMEVGGVRHLGANWFAPGVGHIRQTSVFERPAAGDKKAEKHESVIELKKFEPGK